jgi:tetratricopeptide (TPR) repeat protein
MVCGTVIENNPGAAVVNELAVVYWEALLQTEQYATLDRVLGEAVERGDRALAAAAQVKRGDISRKRGEFEDALVDGYLRTIVFFRQIKQVQPEALYKAAKCFEELGQHSHAEKMRKKLLADFPKDPYTEKIRSGG